MESVAPRQISPTQHFHNYANQYEANSGGATRLVAERLAELTGVLPPSSRILDNATGTGLVIDELLRCISDSKVRESLHVTAVDAAPGMIELLKSKNDKRWKLRTDQLNAKTLAAEAVSELSATKFTHSYTNFGFQFFKDPSKAAAAVYRTLIPGGVAYITTWSDLGYMDVMKEVSYRIQPDRPPLSIPFPPESFSETYVRDLMIEAGFRSVEVQHTRSRFRAADVGQMAQMLGEGFAALAKMQGWSEAEVSELVPTLKLCLDSADSVQKDQDGVHIPMVAHVAVCRKT